MPRGDKRADYGAGAPLPPELDPRRGRPGKAQQQVRVSDLQARNSAAPTRGRHRTGGGGAEPPRSNRRSGRGSSDAPNGPGPKQGSTLRRGSLIGGRIIIAMLSVAALIGSGIAWATYRQFTQGIQHGVALPKLQKGQKRIDGKDQNILLLGNDSIAGATPAEVAALGTTTDRSDSATDTMMVLHVPADGSKASIVSFPRDTWVAIPGHGMNKINAAYVDGYNDAASQGATDLLTKQSAGIALSAQTLSNLTGLHIDHYVQVNLLGFYDISEAIGGVNLCLNQAQNASTEADASHPNGYSGIDLKKGWNYNVKGKQALAFVRQRHGLAVGGLPQGHVRQHDPESDQADQAAQRREEVADHRSLTGHPELRARVHQDRRRQHRIRQAADRRPGVLGGQPAGRQGRPGGCQERRPETRGRPGRQEVVGGEGGVADAGQRGRAQSVQPGPDRHQER